MPPSRDDLEAAIELRQWAEARATGRRRARSVAAVFGQTRLTRNTRKRIDEALRAAGIETTPSIIDCDRDDWLRLEVAGERPLSDALPCQMVTWHEFNWTGEGDSGPNGEWLRCLKNTLAHQRQFVWSGSKVAGIVTFSGWVRPGDGFFEGWGSLSRLLKPVDRAAAVDCPRADLSPSRTDRGGCSPRWAWAVAGCPCPRRRGPPSGAVAPPARRRRGNY